MNAHEAVTKIANDAIIHIREFAVEAMQTVLAAPAEDSKKINVEKRTPRSARTPSDVQQAISTIEPGGVSAVFQHEAVISTAGDTTVSTAVEHLFDLEARSFPSYNLEWFNANLEQGRQICRDLLTQRLKTFGGEVVPVRKEMMDITGLGKVVDFNANHCLSYYEAATKLILQSDLA